MADTDSKEAINNTVVMDNKAAMDKTTTMAAVDISSLLTTNNNHTMVKPANIMVVKEVLKALVSKAAMMQHLLSTSSSPLPQPTHPIRVATQ
jgi:hypothetical protein